MTWTKDQVLAFIQSPVPTRYRLIRPDSSQVYARCAMDALYFPLLSGEQVTLLARPPGMRERLRVRLRPEGPDPWPEGWVIAYPDLPTVKPDPDSIARNICPYVHLFPNAKAAEAWRQGLPAGLTARVRLLGFSAALAEARLRVNLWP